MIRLLKNIALFAIAILLLTTIGSIGLIFTLVYTIINFTKSTFVKYWADLIYTINVGIDKIGNVLLGTFLNRFAVRELKYPFGRIDDTISYALAKNIGYLSPLGQFIVDVLETIDPGHMQDSLDRKI